MIAASGVAESRELLYFADPMCSWCYGFAPVVDALAKRFEDQLSLRIVMGGLRAGNTEPMRDKDRAYIRDAWKRVAEASGQPFDLSFFERAHFVYDTEPACRAVVTARQVAPDRALAMKAAVSSAFYAHNRDVTRDNVLADVAAEIGFDRTEFHALLTSPEARNATFRDFMIAKEAGVQGYPLLAAGSEATGYALITHGFRPLDGLPEAIEQWLDQGAPVTPAQPASQV